MHHCHRQKPKSASKQAKPSYTFQTEMVACNYALSFTCICQNNLLPNFIESSSLIRIWNYMHLFWDCPSYFVFVLFMQGLWELNPQIYRVMDIYMQREQQEVLPTVSTVIIQFIIWILEFYVPVQLSKALICFCLRLSKNQVLLIFWSPEKISRLQKSNI